MAGNTLKSTSDYMRPGLVTHTEIKLWLHRAKAGNSLWNQSLFTWAQGWELTLKSISVYMGPSLGTHAEINLCLHATRTGNTHWNQALITWGQGWELTLKSISVYMGPSLGTHAEINLWLHGTMAGNTLKSTSDYMRPGLVTHTEINIWLHATGAGKHALKLTPHYIRWRLGTDIEINYCHLHWLGIKTFGCNVEFLVWDSGILCAMSRKNQNNHQSSSVSF